MTFTAILLVCALPMLPGECNETNAVDLISTSVSSELGCGKGFQEVIARGSLREGLTDNYYLKTLCRRNGKAQGPATPRE